MMNTRIPTRALAALSLSAALLVSPARAQSTAFTYQGRLSDHAVPVNGLYDFTFRLFDAPSGGSQVGATECVNNILVAEGLFSAQIDFGPQYATTGQRYLEIEVRVDSGLNCTNAAGFVVLAPRQQLTATPLASHANSAFALDAADGSPASAVFVDNGGLVGIGTNAPTHKLHVAAPAPVLALQDSDSNLGAYVSFRDINNVERGWIGYGNENVPHLGISNTRAGGNVGLFTENVQRMTIQSSGNVGIGTTAPLTKLDVRGDVRLGPFGQYRAAAGGENLRIIRGVINWTGAITSGLGFGVSHTSTGQYNVTFTTPFSGTPAVTATVMETPSVSLDTAFAMTQGITASGVNLEVLQRSNGGFVNRVVQFIAIGPR